MENGVTGAGEVEGAVPNPINAGIATLTEHVGSFLADPDDDKYRYDLYHVYHDYVFPILREYISTPIDERPEPMLVVRAVQKQLGRLITDIELKREPLREEVMARVREEQYRALIVDAVTRLLTPEEQAGIESFEDAEARLSVDINLGKLKREAEEMGAWAALNDPMVRHLFVLAGTLNGMCDMVRWLPEYTRTEVMLLEYLPLEYLFEEPLLAHLNPNVSAVVKKELEEHAKTMMAETERFLTQFNACLNTGLVESTYTLKVLVATAFHLRANIENLKDNARTYGAAIPRVDQQASVLSANILMANFLIAYSEGIKVPADIKINDPGEEALKYCHTIYEGSRRYVNRRLRLLTDPARAPKNVGGDKNEPDDFLVFVAEVEFLNRALFESGMQYRHQINRVAIPAVAALKDEEYSPIQSVENKRKAERRKELLNTKYLVPFPDKQILDRFYTYGVLAYNHGGQITEARYKYLALSRKLLDHHAICIKKPELVSYGVWRLPLPSPKLVLDIDLTSSDVRRRFDAQVKQFDQMIAEFKALDLSENNLPSEKIQYAISCMDYSLALIESAYDLYARHPGLTADCTEKKKALAGVRSNVDEVIKQHFPEQSKPAAASNPEQVTQKNIASSKRINTSSKLKFILSRAVSMALVLGGIVMMLLAKVLAPVIMYPLGGIILAGGIVYIAYLSITQNGSRQPAAPMPPGQEPQAAFPSEKTLERPAHTPQANANAGNTLQAKPNSSQSFPLGTDKKPQP
ncbi:MAG: hypothetical protein V4490_04985 [Pseudomonadota bacterium]